MTFLQAVENMYDCFLFVCLSILRSLRVEDGVPGCWHRQLSLNRLVPVHFIL